MYLNRSSIVGITKLDRNVPLLTEVTSWTMKYREECSEGVGSYRIVLRGVQGLVSDVVASAYEACRGEQLCDNEGTTAGTQSAKQLRHTDYFPEGPFCILHCYALRRNKRSINYITVSRGSGLKTA